MGQYKIDTSGLWEVTRDNETWDSHEQEVEEPEARGGEPGELVFEVVVRLLLEAELLEGRQGGELRPDRVVGSAEEVYHELQLVDLGLAGEERFVGEELAEDAATAPHVNRWRKRESQSEVTILYWPKNIYPIFPKKDPQKFVL